jgi:hypothetical protein
MYSSLYAICARSERRLFVSVMDFGIFDIIYMLNPLSLTAPGVVARVPVSDSMSRAMMPSFSSAFQYQLDIYYINQTKFGTLSVVLSTKSMHASAV